MIEQHAGNSEAPIVDASRRQQLRERGITERRDCRARVDNLVHYGKERPNSPKLSAYSEDDATLAGWRRRMAAQCVRSRMKSAIARRERAAAAGE